MGLDFFDADETLLLRLTRSAAYHSGCFFDYSVTFTAEDFQDYQAVNKPLWVDYCRTEPSPRYSFSISSFDVG